MEYCPNGTLFQHIKRFKKLSEIEIYRYLHIIISALQYLHSKGIAHRDIKLENIVFSQDYVPKLIDFGLSRVFVDKETKKQLPPRSNPGFRGTAIFASAVCGMA